MDQRICLTSAERESILKADNRKLLRYKNMAEIMEDEEKANWHPGKDGRLTEGEAHDEANLLRAKTGQSPRNPGYIHLTDRDKILDPRYRKDEIGAIWRDGSSPDQKAEDRLVYERGGKRDKSIEATAEDYDKALTEIEGLEALAEKDISAANKTLRGLLKAGRSMYHGVAFVVLGAGFPNITGMAAEDLDYKIFKERMKTAKEQLQDLEKKAKKFEK